MNTGGYVEYSSNNSGGGWWLKDRDWKALEEAGWKVEWVADDPFYADMLQKGRWLGALAKSARRYGLSYRMAIAEWEEITGQREADEGCHCCGCPHNFYEYDENDRMVW